VYPSTSVALAAGFTPGLEPIRVPSTSVALAAGFTPAATLFFGSAKRCVQ
jgi:hypothetical protein